MTDWQDVILRYYQILQNAVALAQGLGKVKKAFQKEYDVKDIKENLSSGELHFGDKIKTIGTFSEYLPFVDPKFFLTKTEIQPFLPRTARLQAINDVYCGALFKPEQKDAFGSQVLPLFYGIDSKVFEYYTGEMLDLQCQIIRVPEQYRSIINQNSYFAFQKEEGVQIPFGLKVLKAEPYGLVDTFKVNAWLIGNLNPPPQLKLGKEHKKQHCCGNCASFFAYKQIEPVEDLLNYGCATFDEHTPEELKALSEKFLKMEKNNLPYLVFPDIFSKFEVFHPSVDLFDEKQKTHSTNIILGVIEENMESLFQICSIRRETVIPKESTLSITFQYDQINKITSQTFDSSSVPKWGCPNYVSSKNKVNKLSKEDEAITKFKFKKQY
jgi:hypothetical protein